MKKLKKLNKHYSTLELAYFIGVSENAVKRWLKGENKPHNIFKKKIAEVYKEKGVK